MSILSPGRTPTATTTLPSAATLARQARTTNRRWSIGLLVVVVLLFVLYHNVLPTASIETRQFFRDWLSISALNECTIWVIFAMGLNVVVGYAGLLDLGYVAFWALGGYMAGWIMSPFFTGVKISIFGHAPNIQGLDVGIHLNFWLVLPVAGLYCALWGVLIGAPTLRLKSDYLALVTLGFGEIIPQVFVNGENVAGHNISNGTKGILPVDGIPTFLGWIPGVPAVLGTASKDLPFKFLVYALLAAFCIFVSLRIREGRLGRAWLAMREDELAASMMGVPLMRTKLAAYAVGAFAGGLGGVAYATHVGGVYADRFNFAISITLLAMVVLGGMGNVWGVAIGALVLSWINNTGLDRLGDVVNGATGLSIDFGSYQFVIFGVILVLMMLFRREGLIPETRTKQVLAEPERGDAERIGIEDVDEEVEPA